MRRTMQHLGHGLVGIALAALPLAACSSADIRGAGTFGPNQIESAQVPNLASYTADTALVEARNHFRNSDFGYSAALYKRVVDLAPKNPEAYVGLGASYDRLGRFDLSDRVYQSLFKLRGGTAQYYNNLGYSYLLRGNMTLALTNFRKAKALDPSNPVIANNLQLMANAARV